MRTMLSKERKLIKNYVKQRKKVKQRSKWSCVNIYNQHQHTTIEYHEYIHDKLATDI